LPARRVELLVTLLLLIAIFGLVGFLHHQFANDTAFFLVLIVLEIFLPIAMGFQAAILLAEDPALDILLSAYRPAWLALWERLLLTGAIGALFGSAALLLANHWGLTIPKEGSAQVYIWLSPMVFYMGLASTVALLRGRMLDAILSVLGVMGVSLMLLPSIPLLCKGNAPGTPCIGWLASPIMTLGSATDAYWPVNRLLWLILGAALLALSLKLARREEPLLHKVTLE
jgi:hypothetical protein